MGTLSLRTEVSPSFQGRRPDRGTRSKSCWVRASQQSVPRAQAGPPCPSLGAAPRRGHSLFLVPGDRLHFVVGQQVWAVTHLHVHHALLGLHLNELIGDPFDGLPAAPGKGREHLGQPSPMSSQSSRNKTGPTLGRSNPLLAPILLLQCQALGLRWRRSEKHGQSCQLCFQPASSRPLRPGSHPASNWSPHFPVPFLTADRAVYKSEHVAPPLCTLRAPIAWNEIPACITPTPPPPPASPALSVKGTVELVPTSGPLCLQLPSLHGLSPDRPVLAPPLHSGPSSSLTSSESHLRPPYLKKAPLAFSAPSPELHWLISQFPSPLQNAVAMAQGLLHLS